VVAVKEFKEMVLERYPDAFARHHAEERYWSIVSSPDNKPLTLGTSQSEARAWANAATADRKQPPSAETS
jgi:hypothetical protein